MKPDKETQEKLDATEFIIEANSFEQLMLWNENEARPDNKYEWVENPLGQMLTLGTLDNRPVCIAIQWAIINGMRMMFWDSTSQVVDHKMIDKFFDEYCNPKHDNGTRRARQNAMNFHVALRASERKIENFRNGLEKL